jgi:putative MFS transporter
VPAEDARHPPVEAERLSPYLIFLFAALSTATFFEGFDATMLTLAAPDARATLGISLEAWSTIFAVTGVGLIGSFFFLMLADRFGRRSLMLVTVLGFSLCNTATAFVDDPVEFAATQFLARVFLNAEYALAVIMIGEEFPARSRGRAVAVLTSFVPLGVMAVSKLSPFFLLGECAPGTSGPGCPPPEPGALHQLAQSIVAFGQGWLGRPGDGADWRGLYAIGILPLALIFVLRIGMRETRRFASERAGRPATREGFGAALRREVGNAWKPFEPQYRRRSALVVLLWNCVHLVTSPAVAFWVIYAREELGLAPHTVGDILFWGYAGGAAGAFLAGLLVDRVGRRFVCSGFYVFSAVAIFLLFQVRSVPGQYACMIATVLGFSAANTATHIYASELFPTAIRATGYGWATNLFGRISEVVVPLLVGLFVARLGISWSVGVVAIGPVLGALLVLRYAPETRGLTLEEIQAVAGPQGAAQRGAAGAPALSGGEPS